MLISPLNLSRLYFKVLAQSVESLLLQVYLGFGSSVADLLVLLHLEFEQIGVLGYRGQDLHRVVLLRG